MTQAIHQNLAAGRWQTLSLATQLGNIGSEVGRAANSVRNGNTERAESALARAFELIDLTLSDNRWAGVKRREIARLREVCADTFYNGGLYASSKEDIEKYLYHFAAASRRGK